MKIALIVILLFFPFASSAQEQAYCQLEGEKEPLQPGFNSRFCFGTKEYMDAFASALKEEEIPHYRYSNGDIGTRLEDRERVQIIGDSLLCEYIFKGKNCE